MKKILSFLLLCAVTVSVLAGCGYASTAEEREPVFSLMGYDVPYEVYRFYVMTAKSSYGLLDEEGNTKTDDAELLSKAENAAMESVRNLYAALKIAEQYGYSMEDEDIITEAEAYFEALRDSYEEETDFRRDMAAAYMNKSVVVLVRGAKILENKAYEAALENGGIDVSDEALRSFFDSEEVIRVKQILIQREYFANAEEVAAIAYEKALVAEDFDTVFDLYTRSGFYTEDRYLARGETVEEFEEAAFALEIGELSPVVESSAGYSILVRYEKEADLFEEEQESFAEKYYLYQFNAMLDEIKSNAEIQYYDADGEHPFAEIK
ncbi:MAG: peptidylprolyl isomerase [Clostridia bacterium]|nr:peptidylprolyl isomerase [Clostridia bacterium]